MRLSKKAVRHLLLNAQGLTEVPRTPATQEDAMAAIRRMGLLQIDTISVVARSPYLVLWSRLGGYPQVWVEELLAEGSLFEYWAHALCFLPKEDFPLYRLRMREYTEGRFQSHTSLEEKEVIGRVLQRIEAQGAIRSREFEGQEGQKGGWWNWKPEKVALERLFFAGVLMIARRESFQRVYDLRERVLPDWDDTQTVEAEEGTRQMVRKAVAAMGVATQKWMILYFPDYLRSKSAKGALTATLKKMVAEGELIPTEIEGVKETAYLLAEQKHLAEQAEEGSLCSTVTTLLSPFDPVVSDRDRALALFDFFYRIEVYTPSHKRKYGYFTLPILHKGELVGRLDAKAHRKEGRMEIRTLHLEPKTSPNEGLAEALAQTLRNFALWHETPILEIQHSDPPEFANLLKRCLE